MSYKPNRATEEYFRVRTLWPTIKYGKGGHKLSSEDSKVWRFSHDNK